MPTPEEAKARFKARIERRLQFIEELGHAGLALYLTSDAAQRKQAVERLVRAMARRSELPHLSTEDFRLAAVALAERLEAGQRLLPHDVQYRNRIRSAW